MFPWLVLLSISLLCTPLYAQGSTSGSSEGHKLDLRIAAFGSYTNNVLGDLAQGGGVSRALSGPGGADQQNSGVYTGLNGNLNYGYTKRKGTTSFGVGARTNASYYPDLDIRTVQHVADVNVSRPFGQRTTGRFSQSAHFANHYRLELLPDLTSDDPEARLNLGDEYAAVASKTNAYITSTGLSHMLSRRATVGVSYRLRSVHSPEGGFDFRSHNTGASFQYQLSKYGGFHAGYNYLEVPRYAGKAEGEAPLQSHSINLGIDYNRAFSLSGRRTTLTFTTGSALTAAGRAEDVGEQTITSSHLRPFLQGSVTLRRNLFRSWDAQAGYRRQVYFIEGFTDPLFAEGVSAGVLGQLSRYLKVNALVGYSSGQIGRKSSSGRTYSTMLLSGQFAHQITDKIDFFVSYFYLRQQVGKEVVLPAGFAHSLNRYSLRSGVSFRLPLIS
jgi:hypothetical protein